MLSFFTRLQPHPTARSVALAGLGGLIAIAGLALLTDTTQLSLMMAPFGASCVLLFSVPNSPLSQPANVIGGHALSALIGLALRTLLPDVWWAAGLTVGIAIAAMAALRITHPPAGANPLVIFAADPEIGYLLTPVLSGAGILVAGATIFHRLSGTPYPMRKT
ncbi:HPP family protein [Rhizobiales bacterium]|uniref:HPP family protein n=1 Tax=Hongsoonwoonella zoysiae TaxID=2821844 RepID=UPI001560A0DD|nr:HPP family protein [Hongsoonwoonella zoysiae]NRG17672.1 HPP family protein [Hongsoonwoonella zoysiae]